MLKKKYDSRDYPFIITYDAVDRVYIARSVDLKGCHTEGTTPEEAVKNIYEAMKGWIETALKNKITIPQPSKLAEQPKKFLLRLDPQNALKVSTLAGVRNTSVNTLINEAIHCL